MNFFFTSEQLMLASSVQQCFERLPQHENGVAAPEERHVGDALRSMATEFGELGVFGILAPEDAGGLGMGFADAVLIAMEAAKARLPFPMIEQIVAAFYLPRIDPEAAGALIDGAAIATAAGAGELHAVVEGDGVRLTGTVLAPYARHARWLLVGARHPESGRNFAAMIDLEANPAPIDAAPEFDLTQPLDRVRLDHVVTATVPSDARAILALLASAEIVGLGQHVEARTIQFLKDRVQFGEPVGKFQALQHIAADNKLWLENARVAVEYAAAAFDQFRADRAAGKAGDHDAIERGVAIAKSYCSRAARVIARDATQLHGGMGFSWELGLHVPVKRLVRLSTMFGSAYDHNNHLLDLVPVPAPAYSFSRDDH
jgi:alkylation response protein AidB-like acyl-CoA dehydrogenase